MDDFRNPKKLLRPLGEYRTADFVAVAGLLTLHSSPSLLTVIDLDGKIAHYHVGFYAIKPDEGLRPLDEAVMKQIKTK